MFLLLVTSAPRMFPIYILVNSVTIVYRIFPILVTSIPKVFLLFLIRKLRMKNDGRDFWLMILVPGSPKLIRMIHAVGSVRRNPEWKHFLFYNENWKLLRGII